MWASWRYLQEKHFQEFTGGLPNEAHKAVSRILVLLIPSENPAASHSLIHSPSPIVQHTSEFWMGLDRSGPLWQCPTQVGKLGAHSHALTFSLELCCFRGWRTWLKGNSSSYSLQCVQSGIFFSPTMCQNSAGLLDFHKGSPVPGDCKNQCSLRAKWQ